MWFFSLSPYNTLIRLLYFACQSMNCFVARNRYYGDCLHLVDINIFLFHFSLFRVYAREIFFYRCLPNNATKKWILLSEKETNKMWTPRRRAKFHSHTRLLSTITRKPIHWLPRALKVRWLLAVFLAADVSRWSSRWQFFVRRLSTSSRIAMLAWNYHGPQNICNDKGKVKGWWNGRVVNCPANK